MLSLERVDCEFRLVGTSALLLGFVVGSLIPMARDVVKGSRRVKDIVGPYESNLLNKPERLMLGVDGVEVVEVIASDVGVTVAVAEMDAEEAAAATTDTPLIYVDTNERVKNSNSLMLRLLSVDVVVLAMLNGVG